jgi:hypothetical protein
MLRRFHKVDEAVTPGRMALDMLGLEMEGYIADRGTDTHALLARGRGKIVLSFRGRVWFSAVGEAQLRVARGKIVLSFRGTLVEGAWYRG